MAKEKKLKVPKEVAGIKVPKNLRKKAKQAIALAENPAVRDLALAGLAAAATAIAESAEARRLAEAGARKAKKAAAKMADATSEAGSGTATGANQLGDLIRAAALEGARRLLDASLKTSSTAEEQPAKATRKGGRPAAVPAP